MVSSRRNKHIEGNAMHLVIDVGEFGGSYTSESCKEGTFVVLSRSTSWLLPNPRSWSDLCSLQIGRQARNRTFSLSSHKCNRVHRERKPGDLRRLSRLVEEVPYTRPADVCSVSSLCHIKACFNIGCHCTLCCPIWVFGCLETVSESCIVRCVVIPEAGTRMYATCLRPHSTLAGRMLTFYSITCCRSALHISALKAPSYRRS